MAEQYDVVIIGSGPAGRAAGLELNRAGLSVAMVENYGFGGTCPLRGCEPKKVLVDASFTVARSRDMLGQGLGQAAEINWSELMKFNRSFVETVPDRVEAMLDHEGIATYFGQARFTGRTTVSVGEETLKGKHILIATGAVPRPLNMAGQELVSTSDDFLELKEMPKRVVFVGGGFIAFELGHLAARAGAEVTILEVFDRPLAPFDPDLVDILVAATKELGIDIRLSSPVTAIEKKAGALVVYAGENLAVTIEADLVVHGAGRVPAIAGLDAESGKVEVSPRGVKVNEYMQSVSNPQVYAAGDAAATPLPLTPVADMEGHIAAHNIIHGNTKKAGHQAVPSSVFTYPPLATVGYKEEDADQAGIKYKTVFKDTSKWTEHKRIGLKHAGFKLLIDQEKDRIVGAHILGERAEEMINIFALAMQHGLTLSQIKETIWAYPSFIYNIRYMLP